MKLLNVIAFVVLSLGAVYAQEVDERLYHRYSAEEIGTMITDNRAEYDLITYALDNALYVGNYDSSKGTDLPTIQVNSKQLPSYLELDLDLKAENQYFKIAGEEKVLVVKSRWVLNHEMQNK